MAKLRQIEVLAAGGKALPLACKEAGITDVTYYRWRKEYGGLKADQAKKLKGLERENARLKRVVADLSLEKAILKDVAEGNFSAPSGGARRWNMLGANTGCRSAWPAGCSCSLGARSVMCRGCGRTRTGSRRPSCALPASMGAMATG